MNEALLSLKQNNAIARDHALVQQQAFNASVSWRVIACCWTRAFSLSKALFCCKLDTCSVVLQAKLLSMETFQLSLPGQQQGMVLL